MTYVNNQRWYFYYKHSGVFSKSTFFVDVTSTADKDTGLSFFDDYDEVLVTFVRDKTATPNKYTHTWYYFEGEDFVKREEVISNI